MNQIDVSLEFRKLNKEFRNSLLQMLYPTKPVKIPTKAGTAEVLSDFLSSFNRFAANQETTYEDGVSSSGNHVNGNQLERQVEFAFRQVLGKAFGNTPASFVKALDEAFPISAYGKPVPLVPVRSVVSLYSPERNTALPDGLPGQIPAQQASLYRQSSVIAADALKILAGLEPFVPAADREPVEALRSLVYAQINGLVDEFGRLEGPRKERVETYLANVAEQLRKFGEQAVLSTVGAITTVEDEANATGFRLLQDYITTLDKIWTQYLKSLRGEQNPEQRSLSDLLSQANILLPVIAQVNTDLEKAMDAVGFSESQRRSEVARFSKLGMFGDLGQLPVFIDWQKIFNDGFANSGIVEADVYLFTLKESLPDMTVYDLNEWVNRFAAMEAPGILAQSGLYGLGFIADEAEQLAGLLAAIVSHLKTIKSLTGSELSPLEQVLKSERVLWALDNLLIQLSALADLAVEAKT